MYLDDVWVCYKYLESEYSFVALPFWLNLRWSLLQHLVDYILGEREISDI